MRRRSALAQVIAVVWATLQMLSPGATAVADGLFNREAASAEAHVEAPGSSTCPVVHSPDCGLCRYLSDGSALPRLAEIAPVHGDVTCPAGTRQLCRVIGAAALPDGRAPPTV